MSTQRDTHRAVRDAPMANQHRAQSSKESSNAKTAGSEQDDSDESLPFDILSEEDDQRSVVGVSSGDDDDSSRDSDSTVTSLGHAAHSTNGASSFVPEGTQFDATGWKLLQQLIPFFSKMSFGLSNKNGVLVAKIQADAGAKAQESQVQLARIEAEAAAKAQDAAEVLCTVQTKGYVDRKVADADNFDRKVDARIREMNAQMRLDNNKKEIRLRVLKEKKQYMNSEGRVLKEKKEYLDSEERNLKLKLELKDKDGKSGLASKITIVCFWIFIALRFLAATYAFFHLPGEEHSSQPILYAVINSVGIFAITSVCYYCYMLVDKSPVDTDS